MQERQVAVLTRMTEAVNAGDARGYASTYAEDAVIVFPGRAELRGREAIERHEAELLADFPGARLAIGSLWQQGPRAVAHYAVDWQGPQDRSMGHEGLLFYRFLPSGLVAEERRYNDSFTPMAQLGALGDVPVRPRPALPAGLQACVAQGSPAEAENVATLRASLAALDAEDERAFLALFSDDAVLDVIFRPQPYGGKEAIRSWFSEWAAAVEGASSEVTSVLAAGDSVLVELLWRGTLAGPLGPVSATGRPFTVHRAAIARVEDGRLVRLSAFMDGQELAKAVGQWPPTAK